MKFPTITLLNLSMTAISLFTLNTLVAAHPNCSPAQDKKIDQAFQQFSPLAQGMKKWFDEGTAEIGLDAARQSLTRWFGDYSKATKFNQMQRNQILQRLDEIARGVPADDPARRPYFECAKAGGFCIDTITSYTLPGNVVTLCPYFFEIANFDFNTLFKDPKRKLAAGTMVHEFTHSKVLMGVPGSQDVCTPGGTGNGETYEYDEVLDLAKEGPKDPHVKPQDPAAEGANAAIRNADNYLFYSQEAYKSYCCSGLDAKGGNPTDAKTGICGILWAAEDAASKSSCRQS